VADKERESRQRLLKQVTAKAEQEMHRRRWRGKRQQDKVCAV